jgi:lysozyme family protein
MADFRQAVQKTLVHEGGYQNIPADTGNWYNGINYGTKYGITPRDVANYYPALITDVNCVRNLTVDQATTIYKAGYWKDLYSQINSQQIAEKLFDMSVLFGVGTAVKLLQISMQSEISIVSDGVFGQETLNDVNQYGDLSSYRTVLLNHCMDVVNRNPQDAKFLTGWTNRITS